MKNIFLLILLLTSIFSFGQERVTEQILKIAGHSHMLVAPDLGVLRINISQIDMSANQAITRLNNKTKDVSRQLVAIGFKDSEIKTTSFQINENRIYRNSESKDSGYVALQTVEVVFPNREEIITRILNTFSKSETDFKLGFGFKLSDKTRNEVKEELIKLAINDAKEKAKLIASSAGIKLKKMIEINSGVAVNYNSQLISHGLPSTAGNYNEPIVGFRPQDLSFNESVIIMWEFE